LDINILGKKMAKKLHLKIVGYDDEHNLLVSFATDDSKNSVDDYPVYSFQPHQYLDKTADEIIVEIAKMGLTTALNQDAKETHASNTGKVIDFQDMIGTVKEFSISDITPTEIPVPNSLTDIVVK
jgi:hypothetical protein